MRRIKASHKSKYAILLKSLFVLASLCLVMALWGGEYLWGPRLPWSLAWVTRVIDGDTIEVNGRYRVRYIGVDTPETVHPAKPVQCFGPEASAKNADLLRLGAVMLVSDTRNTDNYGRLLRYVYSPSGGFVNQELLASGFAYYASYGDTFAFQKTFLLLEKEAREERRGLWLNCVESK